MKTQFILQTESDPAPIYVRVRGGRMFDVRITTGLVISPKLWNAKKLMPGMPRTSVKDAFIKAECSRIAGRLKEIDQRVTAAYNQTPDKRIINSEWVRRIIEPHTEQPEGVPDTLPAYIMHYLNERRTELDPRMVQKINVVHGLVKGMERKAKAPIRIAEVNDTFRARFVEYSNGEKYAANTITRNFRLIKTICYHAAGNGIATSPKLQKTNLSYQRTDKIYLTPDELNTIESAAMPHDYLENARDWLLISCETGQRVSDFLRFRAEMIRYEAGKPLIEFTQKKTGKIMTIPLSKRVLAILAKRGGEFPRQISDQRYNEYIKTVACIAQVSTPTKGSIQDETFRKVPGIYPKWQLVTSHIGRRSFATNNYGRIPTSLLIAATGHSTEKMFLEYIGKSDTQKALALAEYF